MGEFIEKHRGKILLVVLMALLADTYVTATIQRCWI